MDTQDHSDFFHQFFDSVPGQGQATPTNGHAPSPRPDLSRPAPSPSAVAPFYERHTARFEQEQGRHVERQELGMVPAQSRKIAHIKTQADIDIVRGVQSYRMSFELTVEAWDYMVRMEEAAAARIARCPHLEARVQLMSARAQNGMTEVPGMITDAFLRREYRDGPDARVEEKWIH